MHTFCTYFDSNYLDRGICLWRSLSRFSPGARLFVCCLDDKVFDVLSSWNVAGLTLFRLSQLEQRYPNLLVAKGTRSKIEYYFTITPSIIRFVLDTQDHLNAVTYLDSDLLFFSDPQPLFDEMDRKKGSVGIIAHRFTPRLEHLKTYGTFNVGWVTFKRTRSGTACLLDWQQKCIEWCYDHIDGDRFADQKYLDAWPSSFEGVVVLEHPGANVAVWNLEPDSVKSRRAGLEVYGQPLIFYHYHGLSQITSRAFLTCIRGFDTRLDYIVRNKVYGLYMASLRRAQKELRSVEIHPLIRFKYVDEDIVFARERPSDGLFLWSVHTFGFSITNPIQGLQARILDVLRRDPQR